MIHDKSERAKSIIEFVLSRDAKHGQYAPSRCDGGRTMCREIQIDTRWTATVTPDYRISIGRHYEDRVGPRFFAEAGSRIFQLDAYRKPKLIANLRGAEISLFAYYPGLWEAWLGIDNGGDTEPLEPWLFADNRSQEWKALTQTEDFQHRPLREASEFAPPAAMLSRRQKAAFPKAASRPADIKSETV
jgi:hypothetical protein